MHIYILNSINNGRDDKKKDGLKEEIRESKWLKLPLNEACSIQNLM